MLCGVRAFKYCVMWCQGIQILCYVVSRHSNVQHLVGIDRTTSDCPTFTVSPMGIKRVNMTEVRFD